MKSDTKTRKTYIDQGWAWVILIATTGIMILVQGNIRSFGIFVAELQREFQASAAVVSSILSTQAIANSICAFIVLNCLSKLVSMRVLVITGCLSSTLCFILDSQTTKIELVTIYHVFNGIGIAFSYGPSIVMIGHYFVKYRGTANALTSCGASVGQFALSPLLSYLVSEYSTKGALLINAGIFIQCIVFAMLLRPTSFFRYAPTESIESEEDSLSNEAMTNNSSTEKSCMIDTGEENEPDSVQEKPGPNSNGINKDKDSLIEISMGNVDIESKTIKKINYLQDDENSNKCVNHGKEANVEHYEDPTSKMIDSSRDSGAPEQNGMKSALTLLKTIFTNVDFKLFKSPIFLTYFFGSSIGQLASTLPQAFFPSHAVDMGLDRKEGMLFVAIAGFADLGGRVLTTVIADQKWLNRPRFLGCVLITHGIVACFIPLFNGFQTFAAYCVLYGASGGIVFAISTTILTDYIGVEKLSQGLGLMLFFNGFTAAGSFLFIGYFREFIGSYNPGFVMNGVSLVISGLFFGAEACIKYEKHSR